ncbi:putative TIM-barrel fold metal-dependent hydrolase [Hamadaea flava]|uniref:Amidohydrolase family protein n=1 Tax=Hamadaea flava TaxID=1742688 RepID=A0ABV8LXT1_9ACTN|nr:amidohydrolase family protein [Hamadaea flava]MCP2323511.1 putative TIM-barrel fold metal-dependent hydrolase [Hamadaea flava]
MRIIDSQIHLWTGPDAPPHHWRAPFTAETALAEMDAAGIAQAINCPPIWDLNASDYAASTAANHPTRFATMAWFPLDADNLDQLAATTVTQPGVVGLRFLLGPDDVARTVHGELDSLWSAAHHRDLPVSLMTMPDDLPVLGTLAGRFPRMRLMIDHLGVLPHLKLPDAAKHLDTLLGLAHYDNVAVKATAVPSMATDEFPYASTHGLLRRVHHAYGSERMFWGTDITRMRSTWTECLTMFTDHLPWLTGSQLELVMGQALAQWINWP